MSKRNYKAGISKRPDEVKRPAAGSKKLANSGGANGKVAAKGVAKSTTRPVSKGGTGKSAVSSKSQAGRPMPGKPTVLTVRIVGVAIALLAVAGGVAWGLSVKGVFSSGAIAGLVLLGLVAIIAIFGVIRAEQVLARTLPMIRR